MPLNDDDPKKWIYKEHTRVKHEILEKYLKTWINVLAKWYKVCYFDCFAGRGRYTDGKEGSPLIALRAASDLKNERNHINNEIELIFIEKDKNNYENLQIVVNEELDINKDKYSNITVKPPINDEFTNVVTPLIGDYGKFYPSFFFIDPFGFSGVPMEIIKNILSIPKTEVFINFMIRDVNRFLTSSTHLRSLEELFGIENVLKTIKNRFPDMDRESALLKLYREQLKEYAGADFNFPFKVNADEKVQTTYYLIHATNSLLGCEIMKRIMNNTGTKGRFGYLGPAEGQMALANFGDLNEFKEYLLQTFNNQTVTFEQIRRLTINETPFLENDYKRGLLELGSESKVLIDGKGKRGAIKNTSVITFNPKIVKNTNEKEVENSRKHDHKELIQASSITNKPEQSSLFDF